MVRVHSFGLFKQYLTIFSWKNIASSQPQARSTFPIVQISLFRSYSQQQVLEASSIQMKPKVKARRKQTTFPEKSCERAGVSTFSRQPYYFIILTFHNNSFPFSSGTLLLFLPLRSTIWKQYPSIFLLIEIMLCPISMVCLVFGVFNTPQI